MIETIVRDIKVGNKHRNIHGNNENGQGAKSFLKNTKKLILF